ncbi:hypothetical protein SEPCBS119000_000442 [Sporothrix epigloea]|uniref:Spindle pole body component n=1 Tax=Sporothrix epigloea TaxID=1892477 RepID=A0ABP0D6X6_9PEZI
MAHLAELTAQAEELVAAVTSLTRDNSSLASAALRDATLKSLLHHNNLRTNQFEVESRLVGLAERFAVAGREGLSEALGARMMALAQGQDENGDSLTTKWTPDILHFLLELSDRPTSQPNLLDDLNALIASRRVHEPPPLRWEDIAREEGWGSDLDDDDAVEHEEDDDSSLFDDDDAGSGNGQESNDDTNASSVDPGENRARVYHDLVATNERTRDELTRLLTVARESQQWRTCQTSDEGGRVLVSELQIVRESLFMLQGLETTLFGCDCVPVDRFRLSDVSLEMHRSLVEAVAAIGRKLIPLRRRAKDQSSSSRVALLQVFEAAIGQRLHAFDQEVTQIQARFIQDGRQQETVVSITAILYELQPSLGKLFALADVVQKLGAAERSHTHAFRYLEVLFDATCMAQFEGESGTYAYLAALFFECFEVYLRPLRAWMEDGVLDTNEKVFFVSGAATGGSVAAVPLNQIWHGQYRLLCTSTGALHAPRFLQPAASKIFTTGKSIVVLRQLGKHDRRRCNRETEPTLDFSTVCPPDMALAPFAQLFGDAFEAWIRSKHHAASATLQATLLDACGLWASLEALHCVYLMADGAAVDAFASRVFHSLDARNARWLDRYTMTEMAREAFAEPLGEDVSRLAISVDKRGLRPDSDDPAVARRSVRDGLARIRLTYRLAWPVQIIIPADTITRGYQAVFTLLLQLRRASAVLSRQRLLHQLLDDAQEDVSNSLFFSLRSRLLWFCNTLQSYLTTLVIAPGMEALRASLQSRTGADVDDMIAVHDRFVRALVDEALLGTALRPLHAAVLDLLDLALRLDEAHRRHAAQTASALHETWRLSVLSVPTASPRTPRQAAKQRVLGASDSVRRTLFLASPRRRQAGVQEDDEMLQGANQDDEDDGDDEDDKDDEHRDDYAYGDQEDDVEVPYRDTLCAIRDELDSTLRFLAGGLRGVARASRHATAAAKWDMLAEMLGDDGSGRSARSRGA